MAFGSTSNTYLPSRSVIVPFVVPFTTTLTPNRGSPLASVIVPVIFRDCCVTEVSAFNTELYGMIAPPANIKKVPFSLMFTYSAGLYDEPDCYGFHKF